MVTEITALAEVKRRLERALAETEGPFQVGRSSSAQEPGTFVRTSSPHGFLVWL